jgi:hypothetical protein
MRGIGAIYLIVSSKMREVTFSVMDDFRDEWLECIASAEERTALLRFACSLPRQIGSATIDHARLESFVAASVQAAADRPLERALSAAREAIGILQDRLDVATEELASLRAIPADVQSLQARDEEKTRTLALYQSSAEKEHTLGQALQAQLAETRRLSDECHELRLRVEQLKTPSGRGRTGETAVEGMALEVGFEVEDTSVGSRKDQGCMDLLLTLPGREDVRIAVEIKNKDVIKKSDLDDFEHKAHEGKKKGLFDSAIFVSLRAPVRRTSLVHQHHHALDFFSVEGGSPDASAPAPLSYCAPAHGDRMSCEDVQSHLCMHAACLLRCRAWRSASSQADGDGDAERLHQDWLVEALSEELRASLHDMNAHAKALSSLTSLVRGARSRAIQLMARLCSSATPPREVPSWVADVWHGKDKKEQGVGDALSWRNFNDERRKRIHESLGGKEAYYQALKEMVEDESMKKKKRAE